MNPRQIEEYKYRAIVLDSFARVQFTELVGGNYTTYTVWFGILRKHEKEHEHWAQAQAVID